MKTLSITSAELNKKVNLGYFEIVNQISVFKFEVREFLLQGGFNTIIVNTKTW